MHNGQAAGELIVGMGEIRVAKGSGRIGCIGIGSCVAVLVYHPVSRTAICAHVVLPDEPKTPGSCEPGKHAPSAIRDVVSRFGMFGIAPTALVAAIVGGAELFSCASAHPTLQVGERNVEAVLAALAECQIRVVYREVGQRRGRSISFDIDTALLEVRTAGSTPREIDLSAVPKAA